MPIYLLAFIVIPKELLRLLRGLSGKASAYSAADAGDTGPIPGSVRSPGVGNGNLLQYSFLENPMDRRAGWATVHGVAESRTQLITQHSSTSGVMHN